MNEQMIANGEIDPLMTQAMNRLAQAYPQEYANARDNAKERSSAFALSYCRTFGLPEGTDKQIGKTLGISAAYVWALRQAKALRPETYQKALQGAVSLNRCYTEIVALRKAAKPPPKPDLLVPAKQAPERPKVSLSQERKLPKLSAKDLASLIRYAQETEIPIAQLLEELKRN